MYTLIYRFVRRAINHLANGRTNSLPRTINSVMSYIIETCSSVLVTSSNFAHRLSKIHRVLKFAQFLWLRKYIELNTNFKRYAKTSKKICTNLWTMRYLAKQWKTFEIMSTLNYFIITKWEGRYGAEAMITKSKLNLIATIIANCQ